MRRCLSGAKAPASGTSRLPGSSTSTRRSCFSPWDRFTTERPNRMQLARGCRPLLTSMQETAREHAIHPLAQAKGLSGGEAVIATGTHAAHVSAVVSSASLSDATAPATLSPAAATAVSARATETAQAAPRFVLHYGAIGSDTTGLFTLSGHSWKGELNCGTPSGGGSRTKAPDLTVKVGLPNTGFTAARFGYKLSVRGS